jgi:hypothetical protein
MLRRCVGGRGSIVCQLAGGLARWPPRGLSTRIAKKHPIQGIITPQQQRRGTLTHHIRFTEIKTSNLQYLRAYSTFFLDQIDSFGVVGELNQMRPSSFIWTIKLYITLSKQIAVNRMPPKNV